MESSPSSDEALSQDDSLYHQQLGSGLEQLCQAADVTDNQSRIESYLAGIHIDPHPVIQPALPIVSILAPTTSAVSRSINTIVNMVTQPITSMVTTLPLTTVPQRK